MTEEQGSQRAFSSKTRWAADLLTVARVGSVVTARCGDAPTSPPWPLPKSLTAGPFPIFRQALSSQATLWLTLTATTLLISRAGIQSAHAAEGGEFPAVFNTQEETIPLLKPAEALQRIHLPEGFKATLFAGEPDVQQPISISTDARGRLWVGENYTYSENAVNFHPTLRDRVVILEDTNHDGVFDKRTVFWDQGRKLTSVLPGFGGVFVLCPPNLLFIPDHNADDVPDGPPEVLLDGWSDGAIRHTIVNGLKWGPDGWIYGRHGIQATSLVGKPGATEKERTPINVGLWRFHPTRRVFEVVAQGTTNPWGHDWDENGELFFINTVIGHLWHVMPGAYYRRMYGEHATPHLYELIEQTADHFHWDTKEQWSDIRKLGVTGTTSLAGGGHAHSGLMIYLGDNWPESYRNSVLAVNYHGKRLNRDILERRGAGYVAHHGDDFMQSGDPWFRGIDLLYGPDGGVYVSDWSDIGECHDQEGIHRTSGRIYKITYGQPSTKSLPDLHQLTDAQLVELQRHHNDWQVRQARLVLQERAVGGADMTQIHRSLHSMFSSEKETPKKLRALWALQVTGGASEEWLMALLGHPDEHIRVWAVRLLVDAHAPSEKILGKFSAMSGKDPSGLVLAQLASVLQRTTPSSRWSIAQGLASQSRFATDPTLPLLLWYGIEPAVSIDPRKSVQLAYITSMPKLRQFITRRLAEDWDRNAAAVNQLVEMLQKSKGPEFDRDVLKGLTEALKGWKKATPPAAWSQVQSRLFESSHSEVKKLSRELALLFGDGRASDELRALAKDPSGDLAARRNALKALVQNRTEGLTPLLETLLTERDIAPDAIQAFAVLGPTETPQILLKRYPQLRTPEAKTEALNTLASRATFAKTMIEAVKSGSLPKQDFGALQIRQLRSLNDSAISQQITELWPQFRPISTEKQQQMKTYRDKLTPAVLAQGDRTKGREIFKQTCGACHKLFGEGGELGPDLTGSDRRNLDYLLDNILDPSGVVPENFRTSVVTLKDGRVINGILGGGAGKILTLQTPAEKMSIDRGEVASVEASKLSMMPEGILDAMNESQVRDLVAYLMSPGR